MSMKQLLCFFAAVLISLSAFAQKSALKPNEDYVVTISTKYGDMIVLLYDKTPQHKANFIKLAQQGFYDSTTFHRIISQFMIQGGDPNSKDKDIYNDGQGGPGYTVPAEFSPELKHVKGALCAARMGDNVNPEKASSGSQFYIVQSAGGAAHLDGNYTVFGQVINGLPVIDLIAQQPTNVYSRPDENIYMKVTVVKMKKHAIIHRYNCASFYGHNPNHHEKAKK